MTKSELLIRSITGPVKMDIRLFAFSVEIAEHMLFTKKIPLEQLQVTVDIYPQAAKQFSKSLDAAERQIERLGNFCWDCMDAEQVQKYIGRKIRDIRKPNDMIFYFAFYLHFGEPFFQVIERHPEWIL